MKNYFFILGLVILGSIAGGAGYLVLEELKIIKDPQAITVFLPVMVFCGGLIAYTKATQVFRRIPPSKPKKWHYVKQIGFSLIEILLVLSMIGILAAAILVRFKTVRERARDVARVADMKRLSTALTLYYNAAGGYPHILDFNGPLACGSEVYMPRLPHEPTGIFPEYSYSFNGAITRKNVCGTSFNAYSDFIVVFRLEKGAAGLSSGSHTLTSKGVQ